MTLTSTSRLPLAAQTEPLGHPQARELFRGDILLSTRNHTAWGAGVTAQMYLSIQRASAWEQLTDYSRWVHYFPDLTRSVILNPSGQPTPPDQPAIKYLHQTASKNFLFLTAHVEIYLKVLELPQQHIQFRFESGSFNDFSADLTLTDLANGTLLTYSVEATPTIPVPGFLIQQAIQLDLPTNMRQMRQVLCR